MITEASNPVPEATGQSKARSSRNALTFGLVTMNDFVRDNEAEDYTKICTSLWKELTPEGTLEQNFTTEIVSATWRLRRCRMADEALGLISTADPLCSDPMLSAATEKQQKSVDRARAQAHNVLRRSIAELRALQTERTIRHLNVQESIPGLTDTRQLLHALKVDSGLNKDPKPANHEEKPAEPAPAVGADGSAGPDRDRVAERFSAEPAVTKESIARPYPNSDRSEDQQPLVRASFCKPAPQTPVRPQRFNRQALSQQRPLRRPATSGQGFVL